MVERSPDTVLKETASVALLRPLPIRTAAVASEPLSVGKSLTAAGFCAKAATEVFDEIQPCFGAAVESREDGIEMLWNLTRFVQTQLTARPVDQLQVLIK